MTRRILVALTLAACFLPGLGAWNETGHRLIAAIAYDALTPQARARVDALLRQHPDYESILTKNAPTDEAGKARAAFLTASSWPDMIRSDPRFYDESRAGVQPTAQLPGFPSMASHPLWHYVDFNFSEDGTLIPPLEIPNALGELPHLIEAVGAPTGTNEMLAAYSLPWLMHLTGDVHNPLHTVSRYSMSLPKGDRGGNDVWVRRSAEGSPVLNLHSFWDGLAGSDPSPAYVDARAAELAKEYTSRHAGLVAETHPETWVVEGFYNARTVAYTMGRANGTRESPVGLSEEYESISRFLAHERIAAAGVRLAAVLNAKLR
ncbi:MAG: S1/P1 nuclease [Bryobacteraceae bacterium]